MNNKKHYLYLLSSPHFDYFKIGITQNLVSRVNSLGLQVAVSESVIYAGKKDDVRNAEKYLHSLLCKYRVLHVDHRGGGNTEWFDMSCKLVALSEIDRLNSQWGNALQRLAPGEINLLLKLNTRLMMRSVNTIAKPQKTIQSSRKITQIDAEITSVFMQLGVFTPVLKSTDRAKEERSFILNSTEAFKNAGIFSDTPIQEVELHSNTLDIDTDLKIWRGVLLAIKTSQADTPIGDSIVVPFNEFVGFCGYPRGRLKAELRQKVENSLRKLMRLRINIFIDDQVTSLPLIGVSGLDYERDTVLINPTCKLDSLYSIECQALTNLSYTTELSRKESAQAIYLFLRSFVELPTKIDINLLRERLNLSSRIAIQNQIIRKSLSQLSSAGFIEFEEVKKGHDISFSINKFS